MLSSGRRLLLLAEVYAAGETPIVAADGRALARVPCAWLGKVEPIFVEQVADLPQAIVDDGAARRRGVDHGCRLHRQRCRASSRAASTGNNGTGGSAWTWLN